MFRTLFKIFLSFFPWLALLFALVVVYKPNLVLFQNRLLWFLFQLEKLFPEHFLKI